MYYYHLYHIINILQSTRSRSNSNESGQTSTINNGLQQELKNKFVDSLEIQAIILDQIKIHVTKELMRQLIEIYELFSMLPTIPLQTSPTDEENNVKALT